MGKADRVTISGAAGAWGDSMLSTPQLLADGRSDYVVYEGLAEITMAILTRAKAADPDLGYARDIVEVIAAHLAAFRRAGMKVVTNAGGVNPRAAAAVVKKADPSSRVAVVTGDDLMGRESILESEHPRKRPLSANVYLGAWPIATALDAGAEIVVTGRVVDSALALGPLIHEFGWGPRDFDLLSAGSLAGHLIECGPQSTGGLLTDWDDTSGWTNPGYPIAEISADGTFVITAPRDTDSLVDTRSVSEQLLYEIGDPARYVLPDVSCDWRQVTLEDLGSNRVFVSGAKGWAPPSTLKACAQIPDGWKGQSLLFIGGRDAVLKARRVGEDLLARGRAMLARSGEDDFAESSVEVLGAEDTYGPHARREDTREVVLKLAVRHSNRDVIESFIREIPSIALAGPPGVSGGGTGLPRPTPVIQLACFGVDRELIVPVVEVDGLAVPFEEAAIPGDEGPPPVTVQVEDNHGAVHDASVTVPLVAVAHGRSGDKGADVNIGVRSRHPDFYPALLRGLTAARVSEHLTHLGAEAVRRFELPGIHALNFLLIGGLGQGGTASLRFDPQGKAVCQQLLDMEIEMPPGLVDHPAIRNV